MDAACKTLCDDAVRFAEESPEPDASSLYEDILA
jgi:TPP-dependent pyruvate/acetoin dehydrogenase alpha subunit